MQIYMKFPVCYLRCNLCSSECQIGEGFYVLWSYGALTMFYPVPFRRRGMGEGKGKMGQDDHLCLQKAAEEDERRN